MKLSLSIIVLITFFSCTRTSKNNNQVVNNGHTISKKKPINNTDTTVIDPNTLGCLVTHYPYSNNPEQLTPGTFNKVTYVYNSPKPEAKIVDTLSFNTSVNILKDYPKFYLVCTNKAKNGYIKKTDLYLNKMLGSSLQSEDYHYLIGITKYAKEADTYEGSTLKFIKINYKSNEILDSYVDSVYGGGYELKQVYSVALKNAEAVFHITHNYFHDIETDADLFVIDDGKKISRLIYEEGSGDGGDGQGSNIYLPIKLTNSKKIVLAKNGELTLNNMTAKPELYPYPADCGIPIDQLIVVQYWDEEMQDGQPDYNPDGTAYNDITITSTDYYKWDGSNLKKVKTIKGKTAP